MPTLEQLQYGFDRDSRRTWRQRATTQGWDNAYSYDCLSQVTGDDRGDLNLAQNAIAGVPADGSRWDYDETGNWHGHQTTANGSITLNQARVHDKGNRLMEVESAATMRTDRAGRMIQAVPGPQQDWSQSWQITWDAWSRITQVSHSEGNDIHRYGYDGITRRITRTNNQTGVTLRSYYNDQWRPVEERKNSETTAHVSYLWGARHRDDLVRRDRAVGGTSLNETRYILMDYFSPAAITDEGGVGKERYQFSAFGLRTILNPDFTPRSSSECGMEFSFQGQFADQETGWMNYGYRYYLPALGRWNCKDLIGEIGGLNLYSIVNNNPIAVVDRLGLSIAAMIGAGFPPSAGMGASDAASSMSPGVMMAAMMSQNAQAQTRCTMLEYCGAICCNAKTGKTYASKDIVGEMGVCAVGEAVSECESNGDKVLSTWHTHPNDDRQTEEGMFSGDKYYSDQTGFPSVMTNASEQTTVYDPKTGKETDYVCSSK